MQKWSRGILGGGVLLVVAAAGIWLANVAGSAAGEGGTVLGISPASQNIPLGADPFKIDVIVSSVENLGSYDVTITFNKDVLEYVGIARGAFLGSTGRVSTCISPFPGPNGATATENVNKNGALHFGCDTLGLVQDNVGKPGASGSGTLMSIGFKPKAPGLADLVFRGDKPPEYLPPPDDKAPIPGTGPYAVSAPGNDNGEHGATGLGSVDICSGASCNTDTSASIDFAMQGGVVQVIDPNAPAPTAVPATPTLVASSAKPVGDQRKTIQAVLGTPERRIDDTPVPGSFGSAGDGSGGATGSVAGANNGGRTGDIAPGSPGAAGSAGGSRSATGAPRAGYGPDPQPGSPWPGRVSLTFALAGMGAIIAGVAGNRRAQRA
jgi:hypothetical protein